MIAFGFTAALALVGAASYLFIVREVAPIDWAGRRKRNPDIITH
jgi:hypothetical protein